MTTREGQHVVVDNRRARHTYSIEETIEAGMVLQGSEVNALREGRGQIREAYGVVRYDGGNGFPHAPVRRDEADADGPVDKSHDAVSWRKAERRAMRRPDAT